MLYVTNALASRLRPFNAHAVVVQHMKHNTIPFLMSLRGLVTSMEIIGNPYTEDNEATEKIKQFGTVTIPRAEDLESLLAVQTVLERIPHPFICFDVGGYCSKYLDRHPNKGCLAVIEDTKNGLWFEPGHKFSFPMLSVATSALKDYVENALVGQAIVRNAEHILVNAFQDHLNGRN